MKWAHHVETPDKWEEWALETDFGLVTIQRIYKATKWPPRVWKEHPELVRNCYSIYLDWNECGTLPLDTSVEDVLKAAPVIARMEKRCE